jgi:magnesium chelatase family protein
LHVLASAIARVATGSLRGLRSQRIRVEVDIAPDLPGFSLTGLPSAGLREARERIGSALRHSGFRWPEGRITVHLAPADLRKDGAAMDLAIAAGLLFASGQLARPPERLLRRTLLLGELALDGALRPVRGALALALEAAELGIDQMLVPPAQVETIRACTALPVAAVAHLRELSGAFARAEPGPLRPASPPPVATTALQQVLGQARGVRAIALAAAGRHPLFLIGPPGCGKTMLARALAELLPDLAHADWLARLRISSLDTAEVEPQRCWRPPFRAPHHSITPAALIGGGQPPRCGEITHAHLGVLFLDEVGEFGRERLDLLREPLEAGSIHLARGAESYEYPCRFQLVAAANPCPCGHFGSRDRACRCAMSELRRYRARISGPLRDRIDLWVELEQPQLAAPAASAADCRALQRQVAAARARLLDLTTDMSALRATLGDALCEPAIAIGRRLGMSARGIVRSLQLARTVAALDGEQPVELRHLHEALGYRGAVLAAESDER